MYREALSHCMSGVVSRWNHTFKNGFMNTRFLSWPCFTSSVGCISLPRLADIRFLSWPCFTSSVGRNTIKRNYFCMEELLQATQD